LLYRTARQLCIRAEYCRAADLQPIAPEHTPAPGALLDAVVAAEVIDARELHAVLVDQRPVVFACESFVGPYRT
jgi:hypothetical protein